MGDASDGKVLLAVEQAINEAHKVVADVKDFDELIVLDTTHALTVINKKSYHLETDLLLVRPKDIDTIRYMDDENSRKLIYIPPRELDLRIPYTEQVGTGRPRFYTRRGRYVELFRIPDAAKPLYVQHSQWPDTLTNDTDTTPYLRIDHVIVTLSTEIAQSIIAGMSVSSWSGRAKELLGLAINEEDTRPDNFLIAQPFEPTPKGPMGSYWLNPWVITDPGRR
jgi:hypothetical protein